MFPGPLPIRLHACLLAIVATALLAASCKSSGSVGDGGPVDFSSDLARADGPGGSSDGSPDGATWDLATLRGFQLVVTAHGQAGTTTALTLGALETATTGLDAPLGEAELPPLPPAGIFDARLINPPGNVSQLGNGSLKDLRPISSFSTPLTQRYSINLQDAATTGTLTWTSLPSVVTAAAIVDTPSQDMLTTSQYNSAFAQNIVLIDLTFNIPQ